MLKSCDRSRVSPTEQMYTVNRIAGMGNIISAGPFRSGLNGMGAIDPITGIADGAIALIKKLAGLFTKDPYRDIHIAAQNATVDGYGNVINTLQTKSVQGTLNRDDVNKGIYTVQTLRQSFINLTNDLSVKYPQDSSRYMAGQNEVSALGSQIITDLKSQYSSILSASSSLSDIARSVANVFTGGGGNSVSPLLLAAAAFFIVPRLLKR